MANGRPIAGGFSFSQDINPEQEDTEKAVSEVETKEVSLEERKESRTRNALMESTNWSEVPYCEEQENRFPDSVRVHAVFYALFNVRDPKDMELYSSYYRSNQERGRYVFDSPEATQWDLANSRCFILVRVKERRFLTLRTSNTDPEQPL